MTRNKISSYVTTKLTGRVLISGVIVRNRAYLTFTNLATFDDFLDSARNLDSQNAISYIAAKVDN